MQSNVFGKNEFTKEQYNSALNCVEKQAFIIRKRKPRGGNIELHNTVILKHLKSIMSIQDVTSVCNATYLTLYICKSEHPMNELIKRALKKVYGEDIRGKCIRLVTYF